MPTANDEEHLSALITATFSAKITHNPAILTSGDFHSDSSRGCLVPRWKSPDVMVSVRLGWTSPGIMVRVSFLFPCWCLDIAKIDNTPLTYSFHISIWGAWCIVWGDVAHEITPVATGLAVCETWKSIAVPRSSWLPKNCRKAFACFGQVYLMCLIIVKNLPILGKVH